MWGQINWASCSSGWTDGCLCMTLTLHLCARSGLSSSVLYVLTLISLLHTFGLLCCSMRERKIINRFNTGLDAVVGKFRSALKNFRGTMEIHLIMSFFVFFLKEGTQGSKMHLIY